MKKIYIRCIAALVLTTQVVAVKADVYDVVLTQVVSNNPRLQALRQENIAEIKALGIENNLSAPEVEFEHLWARGSNNNKWNVAISQEFDFPGLYIARRREIALRKDAVEQKYRSALTDVIVNARELLIEIAYCNKAIALENSIVSDMKNINEFLKKAYDNGESTILELNRAKIELANNIVKLRDIESRQHACIQSLKALGCTLDDYETLTYPVSILKNQQEYYALVINDPLVNYYNKLKQAEILGVKNRKMEMFPGIKIGYVHAYEEHTSFNGFSLGLSLPFVSGKGKIAQAKALKLQADWEETAARIERESIIDIDYNSAISNKQLVDMLTPVFSNTNHADLLQKAYNGGQLSVIEYLRELTYFRESEWDFLQIELDYQQAVNRLDKYQVLLNNQVR